MTLFPEGPQRGTTTLPENAAFWIPQADEIDEDGFGGGYFHDTWLIKDVPIAEALEVMGTEHEIANLVDGLAADEQDFERLASAAEFPSVFDPEEDLSEAERDALSTVVWDISVLEGLELGVSGLAHALATVQMLPAASCRSHIERSWSEAPVVLFAADEQRARALQPLAEASGCTFAIDPERPAL